MERWKYKLEFEGKLLRELIDGDEIIENIIAIYNQVIRCLQSLKSCMIKRDVDKWEYEIDAMIEDLQCACPENDLSLIHISIYEAVKR